MPDRKMASTLRAAVTAVEARLFVARRVRLLGCSGLALIAAVFAWSLFTGASVATRGGTPSSVDFAFIYASGTMAASSPGAAAVYDHAAFSAAQADLFGAPAAGLPYYHFLYPPTLLLLTCALAALPFFVAFALWLGGTFALYLSAGWAIMRRRDALLIPAAMPLAVIKNAQLGQNGYLTAGLIGLALALAERRPIVAGGLIGLLSYKPQFGVLFPLAFAAAGRWRVLASAAVTVAVLAAISTAVFGHDIWPAYLASLHGLNARLSPDQGMDVQYQSVFGWLLSAGADPALAWSLQLAAAAAVILAICLVWYRGAAPTHLRAAVLCVGAAAATPYALTYDLCLLTLAVAFLVQDGLDRGFLAGERLLLMVCLALSFLIARPIGPVIYAGLLGLCLWRWVALREPRGQRLNLAAATATDQGPANRLLAMPVDGRAG